MSRLEEIKKRSLIERQVETNQFLSRVNVLHNNIDCITIPSMSIMKEMNDYYIKYYIAKYPNCLSYSISRYKKDYPFSIYYSKDFFRSDIPDQYKEIFTELEKYFESN